MHFIFNLQSPWFAVSLKHRSFISLLFTRREVQVQISGWTYSWPLACT